MFTAHLSNELAKVFRVDVGTLKTDFAIAWDQRTILLVTALANRLFGVMLRPESLQAIETVQELQTFLQRQKPLKRVPHKASLATAS